MSNLSNRTKKHKVASVVLSITTTLWLSGAAYLVPSIASAAALTEAQIQSIISLLQSFGADQTTVNNVNSSLRGQATSGATPSAGACSFTKDLTVGSKGDDVTCLQNYLTGTGHFTFSGGATGNFGSVTKAAVSAWQAANGVTPAVGYFGSISRAKYSSVAGATPATPAVPGAPVVTPVGSGLTVSAGVQPAASLFPWKSTRVPFTVMNLTASSDGDVTVDSITIERTGLANDASFAGAVLLDSEGTQIGIVKTFNSLHQAALTEDFVVKAGQTKTLVIAGNAQTTQGGYGGQVAYLSVVSIAANATVNGTFPVVGAGHTINETLTIGTISTAARGALDPGSSQTKEVGVTAYTFSSIKLTAGSAEDIHVKYLRWYQSGSASKDDLTNIKVIVDGTSYSPVVSADGKYYTTVFTEDSGKGIKIAKGFNKEFSIKGDIAGGSARTIDFDVQKRTDIAVNGNLYGYGITPPLASTAATADGAAFNNADDPYYDAAQVTISAGTMTVSVNNVLAPAQNIAINLANQPLGAFTTNVKGEPISVAALHFNVHLENEASGEDADDITSVSLYDENGAVIAGPVDGAAAEGNASGSAGTATGEIQFTDTITFPIGVHSYILKGKIGTDLDNDDTFAASTTPSGWGTVTGQVTGNTITPSPTTPLTLSIMTIKAGSLTVSVSTIPIAQTVIAGSSQFLFANYILDGTASGEDIRVTSLPIENNVGGGGSANDLTNCKVYDGSTVVNSSNVKNPSSAASNTSFVLDGSGITISKGTSKSLGIKCDISASAAADETHNWGIDGAEDDNFTGATGLTSGQTVTEVFTDSQGQTMTVATGGSLSVAIDAGSPGYKIITGGSTGVELLRVRFSATNEDVNIRQVAIQLSGVASNAPSDLVGRKVTLWNTAGVQIGEAIFPTGDTATSSSITGFTVPRSGSNVLIVKGDIAAISDSGPITASGELLKVDYDGDNEGTNGNYGVGAASGSNVIPASSDTSSSGVRVNKGYPTFAKIAVPSNALTVGSVADKTLYRFSVTANSGDVAFYKWSFTMGSSSVQATTSTYGLYVYSDSSFSIVDSTFSTDGLINYGNCVNARNNVTNTSRTPGVNNSPIVVEVYPDKGTTSCNATTTYVVPSGATRYFALTANVSNVESATGVETISTQLDGDAAYAAAVTSGSATGNVFTAAGVDSDSNDDLIWSPRSTSTAASVSDLDWTNGFALQGLPGTNMTTEYFTSPN